MDALYISSLPIGVFDSGVGGISVLQALTQELPHEQFIYYGDSGNAPYGEKSTKEVLALTHRVVNHLLEEGIKALVIACNTATSVAIEDLRKHYPKLPIVGMEPALKPAVEFLTSSQAEPIQQKLTCPKPSMRKRVLVLATPITLTLDKYQHLVHELMQAYGSRIELVSHACPGLAARIEQGSLDAPDLIKLLEALLGSYRNVCDAVVLGCTHYPFIAEQIKSVLHTTPTGECVPIFEGGGGAARYLKELLVERELLRTDQPTTFNKAQQCRFETSADSKMLARYQWFYQQPRN